MTKRPSEDRYAPIQMSIAEKLRIAKHGLGAITNCPLDEDWGDTDPARWMAECAKEHLSIIEHGGMGHWEREGTGSS